MVNTFPADKLWATKPNPPILKKKQQQQQHSFTPINCRIPPQHYPPSSRDAARYKCVSSIRRAPRCGACLARATAGWCLHLRYTYRCVLICGLGSSAQFTSWFLNRTETTDVWLLSHLLSYPGFGKSSYAVPPSWRRDQPLTMSMNVKDLLLFAIILLQVEL